MSFARNIMRDLVERRLWPIALLLLVALAAIPLLLGGGGAGAGDETVPLGPASAAPAAASAVELVGPAAKRSRAGRLRDPFRRGRSSSTVATTVSGGGDTVSSVPSSGAPSSGAASGGAASSGGTAAGGGDPRPANPGTTVRKPSASDYDLTKVADVRFGKRDGALRRIRNLAPLSELPSAKAPIVMFAGALKGGDTARFFIMARDGETGGDGTCTMRDDKCIAINLRVGDKQLFKVDGAEYVLELVGINSVRRSGSSTGSAYRTTARFGRSASARERALARLAPLGGAEDPALLYLGVYKDGKRALFVLAPNASARRGDGDCMDGSACRVIGLRSDESASVAIGSRRYALAVESVRKLTMTATAAARARAAVADGGRAALRELLAHGPTAASLGDFRYSTDLGRIVRAG